MSLFKEGLRLTAALGLMAGSVGCGASPRSSVSDMEALSPISAKQLVNPNKVVMGRCDLLDLNLPILDGSQIIQDGGVVDPLGYGIQGRLCRAGSTVALRLPVPIGMSPTMLMKALLKDQGVNRLPVSEGIQTSSVSDGIPGQQVGVMVFQDTGHVYRIVATPPANMPDGDWKAYWNLVVGDTRVVR